MSSSQQTTNLGLPIYGDSDVPSWKDTNTPFQTLDDIIGQGGGGSNVVELLDLDNAVILTTTAYTCTKDGAIVGGIFGGGAGVAVVVNNKNVAESASYIPVFVPGIEKGSSIRLSYNNSYTCYFAPYKYQSVDPVINVYNEAKVTIDYTNPLHVFSTNNLSYTATQDCYIIGPLANGRNLKINATTVQVTGSDKVQPIYLKLSRGDTAVVNIADENLKVYSYTVSGSVGGLGEPPSLNYTTPLHKFTNSALTYTATKTCYLFGEFECGGLGNAYLAINNNQMYHARYSNENCPISLNVKLTSGDTVEITKTVNIGETLYVLETL